MEVHVPEFDFSKLRLEHCEEPEEEEEDGGDQDEECCKPISRKDEAVEFAYESAKAFRAAYEQIMADANEFIYGDCPSVFSEYPDELNPMRVFELGDQEPEDNSLHALIEHYGLDGSPNENPGPFDPNEAREMFQQVVLNFEGSLEVVDFAVEVMLASEHSSALDAERFREEQRERVNDFYWNKLRPHRFFYKVFSKVPLVRASVETLQRNMMDKVGDCLVEAEALKELGLEYYPEDELKQIAVNIRRLNKDHQYKRLQLIRSQAKAIIAHYAQEIEEKQLESNGEVMGHFNAAIDAILRVDGSLSLNWHAFWALKRRDIVPQHFELEVLNKGLGSEWEGEKAAELRYLIKLMKRGEDKVAFDHLDDQRQQVKDYNRVCFEMLRELIARNCEEHAN